MKALARTWSPVSLALSCVLASIALCLHADNILLYAFEKSGAAGPFAASFLGGAAVLCVAVFVSAHDDEKRRWSIGVGLVAAGAGVGSALLLDVLPVQVVAVCSGVLLGFGLTCLLRQWGRYYRSFTFQGALFGTGLSFLLASVWWIVMMHAGSPFLFCLGLIVLVLSGSLPLLASDIVRADEVREGFRDGDERWVPSVTIWQVMRQGWAGVAGLMLNFFTIGLTFWPLAAGLAVGLGGDIVFKPVPYLVVALAVWRIAVRAKQEMGGLLALFYRIALPVAAVVMLAAPALAAVLPPALGPLLAMLSYLGVALCNVLGLVILFWSAKSSEVGFSKMFAAFCMSCAVSMGAGMVVFLLVGEDAQMVALWLVVAYLAAMLLAEAHGALARSRVEVAPAACEDEAADLLGGD